MMCEDDWTPETKDYRQGTIIIYKEGKKTKQPKGYGYKFVDTDKKRRNATRNRNR